MLLSQVAIASPYSLHKLPKNYRNNKGLLSTSKIMAGEEHHRKMPGNGRVNTMLPQRQNEHVKKEEPPKI